MLSLAPRSVVNALVLMALEAGLAVANGLTKPIDQLVEECGVKFTAPSRLIIMPIDDINAKEVTRCKFGISSRAKGDSWSSKGLIDGYRENVTLVIKVQREPVVSRFDEFQFSYPAGKRNPVYLAKPVSAGANTRYLVKKVAIRSRLNPDDSLLLVGRAKVIRRDSKGTAVNLQRIDVLWGNETLSAGTTLWCAEAKPEDCRFIDDVVSLYDSMAVLKKAE